MKPIVRIPLPEPLASPLRAGRWGARFGAIVTLFLAVFLSPVAVRLVLQHFHRVQLEQSQTTRALTDYMLSAPLPHLPATSPTDVTGFRRWSALFGETLQEDHQHVDRQRATQAVFQQLYQQAERLVGRAQTHVWARLLVLETRAEARGTPRLFSSPDAALQSSRRWFALIHAALNAPVSPADPIFVDVLGAATPGLSAPEVVSADSRDILRAANQTHLPSALLAAIVDNEQAGAKLAYGLSGGVRRLAASAAQRQAAGGTSGVWRFVSHNVGLTQMSWEDAEAQGPRLKALGLRWVPIPHNEYEARSLLNEPRLNLLFTASRLRGYLNVSYHRPPNDVQPYADAWVYVAGPSWHNRPQWLESGHVWNYMWNGFFKAALYQRLLPAWARTAVFEW